MLIVRQDDPNKSVLCLGGVLFRGSGGLIKPNAVTPKVSVTAERFAAIIDELGPVL